MKRYRRKPRNSPKTNLVWLRNLTTHIWEKRVEYNTAQTWKKLANGNFASLAAKGKGRGKDKGKKGKNKWKGEKGGKKGKGKNKGKKGKGKNKQKKGKGKGGGKGKGKDKINQPQPKDGQSAKTVQCIFNQKGSCKFGDSCKYSHWKAEREAAVAKAKAKAAIKRKAEAKLEPGKNKTTKAKAKADGGKKKQAGICRNAMVGKCIDPNCQLAMAACWRWLPRKMILRRPRLKKAPLRLRRRLPLILARIDKAAPSGALSLRLSAQPLSK